MQENIAQLFWPAHLCCRHGLAGESPLIQNLVQANSLETNRSSGMIAHLCCHHGLTGEALGILQQLGALLRLLHNSKTFNKDRNSSKRWAWSVLDAAFGRLEMDRHTPAPGRASQAPAWCNSDIKDMSTAGADAQADAGFAQSVMKPFAYSSSLERFSGSCKGDSRR